MIPYFFTNPEKTKLDWKNSSRFFKFVLVPILIIIILSVVITLIIQSK